MVSFEWLEEKGYDDEFKEPVYGKMGWRMNMRNWKIKKESIKVFKKVVLKREECLFKVKKMSDKDNWKGSGWRNREVEILISRKWRLH